MTTSGVTDWPLTVGDAVTQSLIELGALSQGEEPTGEEMEDSIVRLAAMLRTWAGEANLFREETTEVTFPAHAGELALDVGIRSVSNAWYKGSYNRILAEWNRTEYLSLPNPGQEGMPVAWYPETGISGIILHLWPVPAVDTVIALDYSRHAQTPTDPSETLDVPQEWQEAVILGLASRLAAPFGVTETAPALVARIDGKAEALYQRLLDRDRPDAYVLEPDY